MKKVFEYNDYRFFLKDFFIERKKASSIFTHRYFARLAGFSSPVFIKLVMDGKSNLSEKSIARLVIALNLNASESAYFETLVQFNQSRSFDKKKELFEKLRSLAEESSVKVLDADQFDYYNKWYNSALREIVPNVKRKTGSSVLGNMLYPKIKGRDVKKAVRMLVNSGFLRENEDGTFAQTNRLISTGSEIESLAVRNHHLQMARLGTNAIEQVPKEDRDISGLTMGISHKTVEVLTKELENFRSRIISIVADDKDTERVFRLNLQLFPLSENIDSKESAPL